MLTTVAVLPQPPLLVPELAAGAAAETEPLRTACRTAARRLGAAAGHWIALGCDERGRCTVGPTARGSFVGFGADVAVALDTRPAAGRARAGAPEDPGTGVDPEMALPLLVAGWVAAAAGVAVEIRGELVAPGTSPTDCAALGARLAAECAAAAHPVGLLVLGDGAATHGEKPPRGVDERAGPFDRALAAALAGADRAALAALDPGLAGELSVAGRAPWQVLAAATAQGCWRGELLHSQAPYGVAYHVAVWTRAR